MIFLSLHLSIVLSLSFSHGVVFYSRFRLIFEHIFRGIATLWLNKILCPIVIVSWCSFNFRCSVCRVFFKEKPKTTKKCWSNDFRILMCKSFSYLPHDMSSQRHLAICVPSCISIEMTSNCFQFLLDEKKMWRIFRAVNTSIESWWNW